jgi:tetratricopeptide (TPR) repeat protein
MTRRMVWTGWWLVALTAGPLAGQQFNLPVGLSELEKRVERDSNDAVAHYNVALGYWNAKRYPEAERELKQAISIEPRFAPGLLALSALPYAQNKRLWDQELENTVPRELVPVLEQSGRYYSRAFMADPLVDMAIMGAVNPHKVDMLDAEDYLGEVIGLYIQGFQDCQDGKYAEGVGRFATLIREIGGERFPQRVPHGVLWYQGVAAGHVGRFDLAIANFQRLVDASVVAQEKKQNDLIHVPLKTNEYRYFLATMMQLAGKTDEALALYREVLTNDLGVYMANVQRANIYEGQKRYAEAVTERRAAINANPDDISLVLDLGVTLGKAGQMTEAEQTLRQAAEQAPRDARSLYWLGIAEVQLGRKDEARAALTSFIARAPSRFERQITAARQRLAGL